MLTAVITDTHYGCRKNSKFLHDHFERFYKNIFFPTLDEKNIKTVFHLGDCFDSRRSIDFAALEWSKRVVFDEFKKRGIHLHLLVGNHDAYYKNTNEINSVEQLLQEYDNITTYSKATEVTVGGLNILLCPWINSENLKDTISSVKASRSVCSMGHFEFNGFRAHRGHVMEDGMDCELFEKFSHVFSGHYHTRSDDGKIFYLGNPYEMFWNDVNDPRGFHIFDTETLEHTPVNNPYRIFFNIYYEDSNYKLFDAREYQGKIVKVIVKKKSKPKDFEKFIDKLYSAGIQELKIVENFDIQASEDFEVEESENTISILNRYIDEAEMECDKSIVKGILQKIYSQACEVE